MKKIDIIEKLFVKKIIDIVSDDDRLFLIQFILNNERDGYSISKHKRRLEMIYDIMKTNPNSDYMNLYNEYNNTSDTYRKLNIRYGPERTIEYKEKMYNRPRPDDNNSIWCIKYWMGRGYTEEESVAKISELQTANSRKHHDSKPDYKSIMPNCKTYWVNKGYTDQESEQLRAQFVCKSIRSYEKYIEKYGYTIGMQKMQDSINKKHATMIERYGTTVVSGYTSKESLIFFLKLYKSIRKCGIPRDDIYWGVSGSREFATRHQDKNYFYDFTIKSKKIIIEYNNTFWHPREGRDFINPFLDRESAEQKDKIKIDIMIERGFEVIVVWDDDNHDEMIMKILGKL